MVSVLCRHDLVELGGGIALIVGGRRAGRVALAAFTLVASPSSTTSGRCRRRRDASTLFFVKNTAVIGGMLMVCAFGPGRYSIDRE